MANTYAQRVNRQLMLAQQHLEIAVDTDSASGRLRQTGVLESALFHLYRAYLDMLRELATNYQLAKPELVSSAAELDAAMRSLDKTSAEVEELLELQQHGFIADMLSCWRYLFQGPSTEASSDDKKSRPEGLISARLVQNWELDRARVQGWLERLREISDRHRDIMVEY